MDLLTRITPLRMALIYTLVGGIWMWVAVYWLPSHVGLVFGVLFFMISGYGAYRLLLNWRQAVQTQGKDQDANRLFKTLYHCNQSAIHCQNQEEFFFQICRHAVAHGGMVMAWIGVLEADGKEVKPVAWYGEHTDYLNNLFISTDSLSPFAQGPTGRAIRDDRPIWCQDFINSPDTRVWHGPAQQAGWASSAALPLHRDGRVYGALSLYCQEIDAFDEVARTLLVEMAANIDFTINSLVNQAAREHAEQELSVSQKYLRAIFDNEPECVKIVDGEGRLLDMNKAGLAMLEAESVEQINQHGLKHFLAPEYKAAFFALLKRVMDGGGGMLEFESIGLNGTRRWLETHATLLRVGSDNQAVMLSITRDISGRKQDEAQLRLAAQVFEQSHEGFVITDVEKKILRVNKTFTVVTGYSLDEVRGKNPGRVLSSGLHDENFYRLMWGAINANGFWQGEIWNRRKDGVVYPELLNISSVADDSGKVTHYVGIFTDLSQLKASEQKLEFLAHHDPLTRLPNRALLLYRIRLALDRAQRERMELALLMLDLDRFKNINDSFGHLAGDELLQQVAKRLSARLRKVDTVARLGGDEFTILLENINGAENAARVATAIINDLTEPFCLTYYGEVKIGASIGISLFPEHGDTPETLLQQADSALYLAKSKGRGRYAYFTHELTVAARKRMALEAKLRKAIASGELLMFYQPQVDILSNRIVGAEALVRWQDPSEGLISPISFIPFAEESGLILAIGQWVLRETCRQGKQWLDDGLPSISLAVNVSSHQFMQSDLEPLVVGILAETGFPAENLELELTETVLMEYQEDCLKILNNLRARGVHFAIDDFGTGYSSLAYLKRFPLDVLKIDKSFIDEIPDNVDDMEIATVIIAIGETLGFKVLAEGVETIEQLDFLIQKGCDLYQGYLKSKPLSAEGFAKLLHEQ